MADNHPHILKGGDLPIPVPKITLGEFLFAKMKDHPPKNILVREAETGRAVSTSDFFQQCIKAGESLKGIKIEPGDPVCLAGKPGIDIYSICVGALFIGAIAFPVDYKLNEDSLKSILKLTTPKVVFCDSDLVTTFTNCLQALGNDCQIIILNKKSGDKSACMSFDQFLKKQVDTKAFVPHKSDTSEEDVTYLICSSGTLGIPKPVMLTNKNLLHQLTFWGIIANVNKIFTSKAIAFAYFFWVSGILLFLHDMSSGVETIIVSNLESTHVLDVIQKHKPVWGLFSPRLLKSLIENPNFKKYNVSSLLYMITAGCTVPKLIVEKVKSMWGPNLICKQSYGATELAGTITVGDPSITDFLCLGKPIFGVKIKIVNKADDSILGPNQEGEVFVKSPTLMKGYMKMEDVTKEVIKNGWYETGDLGYFGDNGGMYLTGRVKDVIKYNKMTINPTYLEEVIQVIPGVIDVVVVGVPLDDENSVPMALVSKADDFKMTEAELIKLVDDSVQDHQKLRGGLHFVEEVTRGLSGKMKRKDMEALAKTFYKKPN